DVLDELPEIPICVGHTIGGKSTGDIPARGSCYDRIECVYHRMPGWQTSTEGVTQMEKLPKAAREYLALLEKETAARIGMVSTGPGRGQTIFVDDFVAELRTLTGQKVRSLAER